MTLRSMLMKWLTVPKSDAETKEVPAVQLWEVRWKSQRRGCLGPEYPNVRPEVEAFTSEAAARTFAASLEMALQLIRNTSADTVTVRKAR